MNYASKQRISPNLLAAPQPPAKQAAYPTAQPALHETIPVTKPKTPPWQMRRRFIRRMKVNNALTDIELWVKVLPTSMQKCSLEVRDQIEEIQTHFSLFSAHFIRLSGMEISNISGDS